MKILIVGLGVIGGGYAMALKEAGYNEVYGIDTNEETLKKAKEMKIIKEGFTREDEIISEMNLIILAIYPNLVKDFIVKNKNKFKENALITDVTGIKQLFINDIVEILPQNIDFVFAHPMAGRENKGIDYATNKVFQGANFLIVETKKNKEENIRKIENLAKETSKEIAKTLNSKENMESDTYIVDMKMTREKQRNSLTEQLNEIINNPSTTDKSREEASNMKLQLVKYQETELKIENLLSAKGFENALVYIGEDNVNVVVNKEDLTKSEAAKIFDLVSEQTGVSYDKIKLMNSYNQK